MVRKKSNIIWMTMHITKTSQQSLKIAEFTDFVDNKWMSLEVVHVVFIAICCL